MLKYATLSLLLATVNAQSLSCKLKNGQPFTQLSDVDGQVAITCSLQKPSQQTVTVQLSSEQLIFSKCSLQFTQTLKSIELTVRSRLVDCKKDSNYSATLTFDSTDAAFKKTEKWSLMRKCRAPGTCVVSGDPHFVPFSGPEKYSFQGEGVYSLVDSSHGLRIQASYFQCGSGNRQVTCISAVAVQYGNSGLVYNHATANTLLRKMSYFGEKSMRGLSMTENEADKRIIIEDGSFILIKTHTSRIDLQIHLAARHYQKTKGQCNIWDDAVANGYKAVNQYSLPSIEKVNDWAAQFKVDDSLNLLYGKFQQISANYYAELQCGKPPVPTCQSYNPCNYVNGNCGSSTFSTSTSSKSSSVTTPATSTATTTLVVTTPVTTPATSTSTSVVTTSVTTPATTTSSTSTSVTSATTTSSTSSSTTSATTSVVTSTSTTTSSSTTSLVTSTNVVPGITTSMSTATTTAPSYSTPVSSSTSTTVVTSTSTAVVTGYVPAPAATTNQDPECPDIFVKQAEQHCNDLINELTGCDSISPRAKEAAVKMCVDDATEMCNYAFAEDHRQSYAAVCESYTSQMLLSSEQSDVDTAAQVRQDNGFGDNHIDCGSNGNSTSTGCACNDGFSGKNCQINMVSFPAYKLVSIYDASGNKVSSPLTSNLLDIPSAKQSSATFNSVKHALLAAFLLFVL